MVKRRTATGYRTRETRKEIPIPHRRAASFGNTGLSLRDFRRRTFLESGAGSRYRTRTSNKDKTAQSGRKDERRR